MTFLTMVLLPLAVTVGVIANEPEVFAANRQSVGAGQSVTTVSVGLVDRSAAQPTTTTAATAEDRPRPKDGWDKMQAVSGLIVGGIVGLIGVIVTNMMAERNLRTTDQRASETIQISRATAVANLVPHLASTDSRVREAALIAVDSLGHSELFLRLAKAFGGEAAVGAVAKATISGLETIDDERGRTQLALTDLVALQASATFSISGLGEHVRASGFVAHSPELVITTHHVVSDKPLGSTFELSSSRGDLTVQVQLIFIHEDEDIAVLRAPAPLGPPLPFAASDELEPGSEVVRTHGDGQVDVGLIQGISAGYVGLPGSDKLVTTIRTRPGDSGAPVFNPAGRVVGMVQAGSPGETDRHLTLLIPSFIIQEVLEANPAVRA